MLHYARWGWPTLGRAGRVCLPSPCVRRSSADCWHMGAGLDVLAARPCAAGYVLWGRAPTMISGEEFRTGGWWRRGEWKVLLAWSRRSRRTVMIVVCALAVPTAVLG